MVATEVTQYTHLVKAFCGGFGVTKRTQQVFLANFLRANIPLGQARFSSVNQSTTRRLSQWESPAGMPGQVSGLQTEWIIPHSLGED